MKARANLVHHDNVLQTSTALEEFFRQAADIGYTP
jgi:hypothetical protein